MLISARRGMGVSRKIGDVLISAGGGGGGGGGK